MLPEKILDNVSQVKIGLRILYHGSAALAHEKLFWLQ